MEAPGQLPSLPSPKSGAAYRAIVLGRALKSSRKKISRFCFFKIGRSPYFVVLQLGSSGFA